MLDFNLIALDDALVTCPQWEHFEVKRIKSYDIFERFFERLVFQWLLLRLIATRQGVGKSMFSC